MLQIWRFIESHAWMPVYLIANLAGLIMIPLGMPGLWVQFAAVLAVTVTTKHMGWLWTGAVLFLALGGEAVDMILYRMGLQAVRASAAASWGAFICGFVCFFFGALIPIPIPFLGAIIMSFIGTFAGAIIGEMIHQKKVAPALRVAAGTVFGRACGIAVKSWIAFLVFCVAMLGLVWDALSK